jgi:hypothetical protein
MMYVHFIITVIIVYEKKIGGTAFILSVVFFQSRSEFYVSTPFTETTFFAFCSHLEAIMLIVSITG